MKFSIKLDLAEIKQMERRVRKGAVPKAAARAINRVAESVRADVVRRMRQHRGLKARTIREALTIRRAGATQLLAEVIASGLPIPLREYSARQTRKGVTVMVNPTRGRKLIVSKGNKAFTIGKFGKHVFVRQGSKRLPIKKLFGPSIPATFLRKQIVEAMNEVAAREWPKRFAHELERELAKVGAA
jgi:hypothetical protein